MLSLSEPFVLSVLPANVHYSESLVWFKASGFWYSLSILWPPNIPEILWVSFHRIGPFMSSNRSKMGETLGWANPGSHCGPGW